MPQKPSSMHRLIAPLVLGVFAALSCAHASAEASDELIRTNFRAAVCNIDSMSVSFRMNEAFGEPLITSKMRWSAGANTTPDCLSKLTHVWIKVRTPQDAVRYIKLSPGVVDAGAEFGPTATESPNWSSLFCSEPRDDASCDDGPAARELFAQALRFEGYEVVTETRTLSSRALPRGTDAGSTRLNNDAFSLDSLLADAVDEAIDPGTTSAPPEVELSAEEQARVAVNNVVTLIASSFAQYATPAHSCETDRVVANWVQARGTCQLNFRSEANHEFTCTDNGVPRSVRATRRANINLATDLNAVAPIRVSEDGWASVVLELRDEIRSTSEGNYKTNRWQFTTDAEHLEDLKRLASSLLTLKDYCESEG